MLPLSGGFLINPGCGPSQPETLRVLMHWLCISFCISRTAHLKRITIGDLDGAHGVRGDIDLNHVVLIVGELKVEMGKQEVPVVQTMTSTGLTQQTRGCDTSIQRVQVVPSASTYCMLTIRCFHDPRSDTILAFDRFQILCCALSFTSNATHLCCPVRTTFSTFPMKPQTGRSS